MGIRVACFRRLKAVRASMLHEDLFLFITKTQSREHGPFNALSNEASI